MTMPIKDGRYKARAIGEVVLGTSSKQGTPFIELYFEMLEGESKGHKARWTGYFGPNSSERTIESLQTCGWAGDELGEFSDGQLHGLDTNEVEAVVENETYTDASGTERTSPRIQWINRLGHLNVENAMTPEAAQSFSDKMKGLVLKMKSKKPEKGDGTDFAFGANAGAEGNAKLGEQRAAAGARKAW
jgi:hypothetical protein